MNEPRLLTDGYAFESPSGESRLINAGPPRRVRRRMAPEEMEKANDFLDQLEKKIAERVDAASATTAALTGAVPRTVRSGGKLPSTERMKVKIDRERQAFLSAKGISEYVMLKAQQLEITYGTFSFVIGAGNELRVYARDVKGSITDIISAKADALANAANASGPHAAKEREEWSTVAAALHRSEVMIKTVGAKDARCKELPGAVLDLPDTVRDLSPQVYLDLVRAGVKKQEDDIATTRQKETDAIAAEAPRKDRADDVDAEYGVIISVFPSGAPGETKKLDAVGTDDLFKLTGGQYKAIDAKVVAVETALRTAIADIPDAVHPALKNEQARINGITVELMARLAVYRQVEKEDGKAFYRSLNQLAAERAKLLKLERNAQKMKTGLFGRNQAGVGAAAQEVTKCKEQIRRLEMSVTETGQRMVPAMAAVLEMVEKAQQAVAASAEAARQRARDSRVILSTLKDQLGTRDGLSEEQFIDVLGAVAPDNFQIISDYYTRDLRRKDPDRYRAFLVGVAGKNGNILQYLRSGTLPAAPAATTPITAPRGAPPVPATGAKLDIKDFRRMGHYIEPAFTDLLSAAVGQNSEMYNQIPPGWKRRNQATLREIFRVSVIGRPGAVAGLRQDLEYFEAQDVAWWDAVFKGDPNAFRECYFNAALRIDSKAPKNYFAAPRFADVIVKYAVAEIQRDPDRFADFMDNAPVLEWVLTEGPIDLFAQMRTNKPIALDAFLNANREKFITRAGEIGRLFEYAPDAWKQDIQVAVQVLRLNADAFQYLHVNLQKNPIVIYAARVAEDEGKGRIRVAPVGGATPAAVPDRRAALQAIEMKHFDTPLGIGVAATALLDDAALSDAEKQAINDFMATMIPETDLRKSVVEHILKYDAELLLKAPAANYHTLAFLKSHHKDIPDLAEYAGQVLLVGGVPLSEAQVEDGFDGDLPANQEYLEYMSYVLRRRPNPTPPPNWLDGAGKHLFLKPDGSGEPRDFIVRMAQNPALKDPVHQDLAKEMLKRDHTLFEHMSELQGNDTFLDDAIRNINYKLILYADGERLTHTKFAELILHVMTTQPAFISAMMEQIKECVTSKKPGYDVDKAGQILTNPIVVAQGEYMEICTQARTRGS